ncbi:hypothetical protein [Ferrovibrio sp.]|uniref:hypothetical protein n=1 Tax=Ferrovibrio sp. TaxID=1917215 RepID=UPI001B582D52|nr:hypothetical protein [Ferrovibrio sp.]MBP7065323.1 hypothetical protein [Ferrovibrio sp.]
MNDDSGGPNEAAEQEFLAFGWQRAQINAPDTGSGKRLVEGFRHGDFAAYDSPAGWEVVALPADMLLGRLPSVSAVRRFAQKCVSFPAQPNGAVIGAARQAMLQAVEEELTLARQAAHLLEAKIDDLLSSVDDIRAKAILFARDDDTP